MATFLRDDSVVDISNGGSTTIANGTIVAAPDGRAAIVEGLAGIEAGRSGKARVKGVVVCDKATGTDLSTPGTRVQIATATQLVTAKASGAADSGNILLGRTVRAAGTGVLTVEVELNGTGTTP
jgi:predicted RecA/RadA family phage recombinase